MDEKTIKSLRRTVRSGSIKTYSKGSRRLYITGFDDATSYDPLGQWVEGLIELNITLASEMTNIGADNSPSFIVLPSPTTGTGTVKVTGMPIDALKYITNVKITPNAVLYGDNGEAIHGAFMYDEMQSDDSINRVIFFDCTFAMPNVTAKTDDGKSIKDCTINVTASPVEYMKPDGEFKTVTMLVVNSKRNTETFIKFNDGILYPTYDLLFGDTNEQGEL